MSEPFKVAVFVGSLRRGSITRMVAKAVMKIAPAGLECRLIEIGDVAMYNEDLEEEEPAAWARVRREIAESDAVLLFTPEYNRTMPACLKNVLDVGSRPQGKNVWDGKPAGVVSVSPYRYGGMGANYGVRQALVYLNVPAMQQPEAYISGAAEVADEQGFKSEQSREFFVKFLAAFEKWVGALGRR